ncbi:MAG: hypothetical protein J0H49_11625 [Acidobacteria bacterium]|nr:hypothetical protein [Acidobacteriota bacterium]
MMNRRTLIQTLIAAVAQRLAAAPAAAVHARSKRLVLVTIGGIRRQESFSEKGIVNVPHLFNDLLPQSLFYPYTVNEGVTSHFNSIASILTGVWQHVDDWGSEKPTHPTMFHYLKAGRPADPNDCWVVTSNKQLTANISPGINVILAKQLLIEAVERIIMGQSSRKSLEREQLLQEMKAVLETDYERIGWGVPATSTFQDPTVKKTFVDALAGFIHGPTAPVSGDELTLTVGMEVLKRLAPAMLMMNFSDVEVAHSGSYSLHLGGIRRSDMLCHKLWQFIQASPELKENTTLLIMNEFGRDPDGSSTNGFFNHRTDTETCRMAWSMVLGPAIRKPQVVERVVRQIDFAPSMGSWMGFEAVKAAGAHLPEIVG